MAAGLSLQQIDELEAMPLQTIETRGRIQLVYGVQENKYPALKVIIGGAKDSAGDYKNMLIKFSASPQCIKQLKVDAIIRVCGELRLA